MADSTSNIVRTALSLEDQLIIHGKSVKQRNERRRNSIINGGDAAFYACLADNNKIRTKYGLETVSPSDFVGDFAEDNRSSSSYATGNTGKGDEIFYDASQGEDSSDDSSDSYSMHDAFGPVDIIDEDSGDEIYRGDSSTEISKSLASLGNSTSRLSVAEEVTHKRCKRRKKLPCPASSMENISIMGILRNNVSRNLF